MATLTAKEIYEQLVKHLPPEERLHLVELVEEELAPSRLLKNELSPLRHEGTKEHKGAQSPQHYYIYPTWCGFVSLCLSGEALFQQSARHTNGPEEHKRSIMELRGLGAEIWEGIDAQEYVDELREEWDRRS